MAQGTLHANVSCSFTPEVRTPQIAETACIHAMATVIGAVTVGKRVMVSPGAVIRGDEGGPILIGDESNVQDGVVIHALETFEDGCKVDDNLRTVDGAEYAVYIGRRVSLVHQCQVHGPAVVMDDTLVGMQALVFKATVGRNCVIEPAAKVIGVEIAEGHYVPAGEVIKSQQQADALPRITEDYALREMNRRVVHVNTQLADGYRNSVRQGDK